MIDINDVLLGIGIVMILWAVSDYTYSKQNIMALW